MRHQLSSRSGLTLIEVVIGLMVLALLQPMLLTALSIVSKTDFQWVQRQNQVGILQLRRKVAQGVDMTLTAQELSLVINDQRIRLTCTGDTLIQNPGSMLFLLDLTSCEWRKRGQYITLHFGGGEYRQEVIIGIFQ